MPRSELLGQTDRTRDIDAAGTAETETFLFQQLENQRQRLLVGNRIGIVDRRAFEIGGDAALSDALGDRIAFRDLWRR